MIWDQRLNTLRSILASLYPTQDDARRLIRNAGLDEKHIEYSGKAINTIHNILEYAFNNEQVQDLISAACDEWGNNKKLREIERQWVAHRQQVDRDGDEINTADSVTVEATQSSWFYNEQLSGDPLHVFVGRQDEIAIFQKITRIPLERRILLIKAEGGMGKSRLMEHYIKICPKNFVYIPIDLKISNVGLVSLWCELLKSLGRPNFPNFIEQIDLYSKEEAFDSVTVLGIRVRLDRLLGAHGEQVRLTRVEVLSDAFLEDLANIEIPTILAIDTYEKATLELRNWITSKLLPRMRMIYTVAVLIAGQEVPDHSFGWDSLAVHLTLKRMSIQDWMEYSRQIGCGASRETVSAFYKVFDGNSLLMATHLWRLKD